ncbi:spore germinant protein [Candidatus Hydrogenisulfobacillus filiaventi]|uniref:Spore germinant protein n=1 Tax=Candidatus Hydrogenisulfobacillus filiaventi TaxID=2707344 RepID=A0A6F8ZG99_9FIRM|nr:SpoVA/SpoVAEb family sporulation membrane protein [Bacillota bacterium]CAB1128693.1 spore germinant protein [Candidatus Hydrogenisulfobacillus filiaventi]
MTFLWAFVVGGLMAALAQLVLDVFNLTPAHVLVLFVVLGVLVGAVGLYKPLVALAGAGATVPLPGFGYTFVEGVKEGIHERGVLGIFAGGLAATAGGIKAAVVFGLLVAALFKPKV